MAKEDAPRDDNWVDRLVEDPANPPQLQVLTGYRGRSAQEGQTRLYFDPELTGWVDIPDDAILLTRETPDENGLGRTLVWTRLDAQIQTGPQAAEGAGAGAEWFQGQVAQDLSGGAQAGVGAGINLPRTPFCPSQFAICRRTSPIICRTQQFTCPTNNLRTPCCPTQWQPWCPPSPFQVCPPTRFDPLCQTIGIGCIPSQLVRCPGPVTQDIQCQFTSNPQICNQVATPNPGCIPIDVPGTPVIQPGDFGQFGGFGQQAQGFGGEEMGAQATQFCPQPQPATQFCPQPIKTWICPVTVQLNCLRTLRPPCRTIFNPECFQVTPDWTWQITTPQIQLTPNLGNVGQFGGFGQQAQGLEGGMGAEAFTQLCPRTQICPQTQFCPLPPQTLLCPPRTSLCPVTQNIGCIRTLTCPRTTLCPQSQICPVTQDCPFEPIPFDQQQFGGGFGQGFGGNEGVGGFGQGFEAQGEMGAQATQFCPQPQTAFCPIPVTRFCPAPIFTRNFQCIRTQFCPRTPVCPRSGFCPVTPGCPWGGPGGGGDPWGGGGGFGGGF
jgi:hypothetical protein